MFTNFDKTLMFIALSPVLMVCLFLDIYVLVIGYPIIMGVIRIKDLIVGKKTAISIGGFFPITKAVLNI